MTLWSPHWLVEHQWSFHEWMNACEKHWLFFSCCPWLVGSVGLSLVGWLAALLEAGRLGHMELPQMLFVHLEKQTQQMLLRASSIIAIHWHQGTDENRLWLMARKPGGFWCTAIWETPWFLVVGLAFIVDPVSRQSCLRCNHFATVHEECKAVSTHIQVCLKKQNFLGCSRSPSLANTTCF